MYLDGADSRVFKQLLSKLGSEDRVQNAMILSGLLSRTGNVSRKISKNREREIKASFPELVGMPFEDFEKMLDAI